jgi:hypothetical protein
MWKSKKFIISTILAVALLAGGISGVVMAADNDDENEPTTRVEIVLDKVAANYLEITGIELNIDALKRAFQQARNEMRTKALQDHLNKLVEDSVITQAEADEWSSWWELKPDTPIRFGLRSHVQFTGIGGPCIFIR